MSKLEAGVNKYMEEKNEGVASQRGNLGEVEVQDRETGNEEENPAGDKANLPLLLQWNLPLQG